MNYIALCVGGIIGGSLRYVLEAIFPPVHAFPLPTLVINLAGAFVLGAFYGIADARRVSSWLRAGFGAGVIGSFTTFSTFCLDSVQLAASHLLLTALYVCLSLIVGPLLAYLGDRLVVSTLGRSMASQEVSV